MNDLTLENFDTLELNELETIDGGIVILGVAVSGALCAKLAAAGITAGITVAGIYYSQKK